MGSLSAVALGISGEKLACEELTRRGYAILATRYRTRVGEIDIVAQDGPTLLDDAFMEKVTTEIMAQTPDLINLNPGCDPSFQLNGPTAATQFQDPTTGAVAWLFTTGPKWWLLDPLPGFTAGGKNIAGVFSGSFQPKSCSSLTPDGLPLNPGCDIAFQANGPTAAGEI